MTKKVKKISALLMAAVMAFSLNIVMPQEVKAAEADSSSFAVSTSTPTTEAAATEGSNGVKVYAHKDGGATSAGGSNETYANVTSKGIKMQNATRIAVVIPANKYAQIKVYCKINSTGTPSISIGTSEGTALKTFAPTAKATEYTFPGPYAGGESGTTYLLWRETADVAVYGLTVDLYDNEGDVPAVIEDPTYTVTGTIISEIDLTEGEVFIGNSDNSFKSKSVTSKESNVYEYTVEEVKAGTYSVTAVNSPALNKAKQLVKTISNLSIQVKDASVTAGEATVTYEDITNVWDFTSGKYESYKLEGNNLSGTYKGLVILTSAAGGKFNVREKDVQVNNGTTVSIPVSGSGTVTVTAKNGKYTLGGVTATGAVSTFEYDSSVEIVNFVTTADEYLYKIEIVENEKDTFGDTAQVMAQYKKVGDSYTVRTVYEISESDLEEYTKVGVTLTVNGKSENSLGATVYQSLKANGETVKAGESKYYVITQITNVPADATINVQGIGLTAEGKTVDLDVTATVEMTSILGQ